MARIRIYIARHLCTAPRPQKEADDLAAAGHEVSVHGMAYRADFSERDAVLASDRPWRWEPAADFTRPGRRSAWALARFRHRFGRDLFHRTGLVVPSVWGYAQHTLAAHALSRPADLTIVHSEGGLAIGAELLRRGHRVGVDFEDWFSRDLSPDQQRGRPVRRLAELERLLLRNTTYATTTSHELAIAIAQACDARRPEVIYNTFPAGPEPAVSSAAGRPVSLHWFSQVVGPERGLDTLLHALPSVPGAWELHLRGDTDTDFRAHLCSMLPAALRPRLHFHATVPPRELPENIARHDIGLALDVSTVPNRNLTISNKFFHYLQAGLAVVASDTAGHQEGLALAPGAGLLFRAGDPASLASAIARLAADPAALLAARRASRAGFVARLSQEHQNGRYAALAEAALR